MLFIWFFAHLFVPLTTSGIPLTLSKVLTFGKTQIDLDLRSYFAASQQMKCKHFFVLPLQNLVFRSLNRTFAQILHS